MVPLGVSMVASHALLKHGKDISVDLFKDTNEYLRYLERDVPRISCFSKYVWNSELSFDVARRIKALDENNIIVFGGPNYPIDKEGQEKFLRDHPFIDFFIFREGEETFSELLEILFQNDLNVHETKKSKFNIPNCHYISGTDAVLDSSRSAMANINETPSPYLSGLCDKFLENGLVPLLQTSRGCPFACTFCQEGEAFFSNVRRYDQDRLAKELEYIAKRASAPNLEFADSNFGMYKQDIDTCHKIRAVRDKYGWPKHCSSVQGKNNKERVLEAASLINGHLSAAIQSTDEKVLATVERQNIATDDLIKVAKEGEKLGLNSFSELILCLPGDTKEAHINSFLKCIDAEIKIVRSHQFMMLPGAKAACGETRERFKMETRFRVVPSAISRLRLGNEEFYSHEIDEICVANETMPFEDYLECRLFTFTVEMFYNDSIFAELIKFLKRNGISISSFILKIHDAISNTSGPLATVRQNFLAESNELWEDYDELREFLEKPSNTELIINGEVGINEQLVYRAVAVAKHMQELQDIAFGVVNDMLSEDSNYNGEYDHYLEDLAKFILSRKRNVLEFDLEHKNKFNFDFVGLEKVGFEEDPMSFYKPGGVEIRFGHSDDQKKMISKYIDLYGLSDIGIGTIMSATPYFSNFYRQFDG